MGQVSWVSSSLGEEMRVACYGHWGRPLLLFPTATADHLDYQRFGMIDAFGPLLDAGVVKLYCLESINQRAWMNRSTHPARSIQLQTAYNRYITEEVVPFVREDCRSSEIRPGVAGLSFGCFHASNQFFRRPDLFSTLIALSGTHNLQAWSRGYFDQECYFNSPLHFVGGLAGPHLKLLKKECVIRFYSGRRGESPRPARAMARVLRRKRIPYRVDVFPRASHDWVWWNQALPGYVHELWAGGPPVKRPRARRRASG